MQKKLSIALVFVFILTLFSVTSAFAAPAGNRSLMTSTVTSEETGIRANYAGYSGFRFTAASDITLTALGRADIIEDHPMANNHDVVIWDVAANAIIAKVTVTPSSQKETGYRYENLATPVELAEGKEYSLVSAEELLENGGDYWLVHHDLTGKHRDVINEIKLLTGDGYLDNTNQPGWLVDGFANYGFVGLNFWYEEEEDTSSDTSSSGPKPPVTMGNGSLMTFPIPSDLGIRANYDGYSGFKFTATSDITITTLGRADAIPGHPMANNHDVVIWDVAKNKIIAKVTVKPSSPIKGGYRYENLSETVTLLAGKEYSIVSSEVMGGDYWFDYHDMTGKHTRLVTGLKAITGSGYLDNENQPDWMPYEDGNHTNPASYGFVGLNFWYSADADNAENPKTGNNSAIYIFIVLTTLSMASLVMFKRKSK